MISRLIDHIPVLAVIIAFLSRLCYLQIVTNDANLFFSLLDDVRAKELTFTRLRPILRSSAFAPIESFKGSHA